MAVPSEAEEEATVYLIVSGIPAGLRSAQLRSYFSQFREQPGCGFLCFHYRHRPERAPSKAAPDSALIPVGQDLAQTSATDAHALSTPDSAPVQTRTCCCVISVWAPFLSKPGRSCIVGKLRVKPSLWPI